MSQQDWVIVSSCIALVLVVAVWLVLRNVLADDEELGPEHRSAAEVASATAAAVAAGARGVGGLVPRGGRAIGRGCRKLAHAAGAAGSALAGVVRAVGRGAASAGGLVPRGGRAIGRGCRSSPMRRAPPVPRLPAWFEPWDAAPPGRAEGSDRGPPVPPQL